MTMDPLAGRRPAGQAKSPAAPAARPASPDAVPDRRTGPDAPRLVLQDSGGPEVRIVLHAGPDHQLAVSFERAQLARFASQFLAAALRYGIEQPGKKKPATGEPAAGEGAELAEG